MDRQNLSEPIAGPSEQLNGLGVGPCCFVLKGPLVNHVLEAGVGQQIGQLASQSGATECVSSFPGRRGWGGGEVVVVVVVVLAAVA